MRFDDSSIDVSGVDDLRGSGGGGLGLGGGGLAVGGGGVGIVGLLIYVVVNVLGGGSGLNFTGVPSDTAVGSSQSAQDLQARCGQTGALDNYTDCRLIKVYNIADRVWSEELTRRGVSYSPPRLAFFRSAVSTGCGRAGASTGPFYCPADERIYFDLTSLEQIQREFGAPGQFAQAYIVAHEFGHHIQNITGTEAKMRRAQQRTGEENAYSVALELQADCYAGVWSTLADQLGEGGIALSPDDVQEALTAAAAVGDDSIQSQSGSVDPDSFTHGSAADRSAWFSRGLQSGDPSSCTTFSERGLQL